MKRYRMGVIGAGNMGMAIAAGAVRAGLCPADGVLLFNRTPEKRAARAAQGFSVTDDYTGLYAACDTVLLAVKPQNFDEVLGALRAVRTQPKPVVISIAAGVPFARIEAALGADCPIIRVMPNTPLVLGKGASALVRNGAATDEQLAAVRHLFDQMGVTAVFEQEDMLNEIIPYNGSAPAYVYAFADAMVQSAAAHGIPADDALRLFCQTCIGACELLLQSGKSAETLTREVCSPGGTTIEAVNVLKSRDFAGILAEASDKCIARAYELGR